MTLLKPRSRWTLSCLTLCVVAMVAPGCDVAVEVGDDDAPDTTDVTDSADPTESGAPAQDSETASGGTANPLPTGDDSDELTGGEEMTGGEESGADTDGSSGGWMTGGETDGGTLGGSDSGGVDPNDECLSFSPGGTCQWVEQVCDAFTAACYKGELAAVSFDCMELRGYCVDAGQDDTVCDAYEAECDGGFMNLDACGEDAYFWVWQPQAIIGMASCLDW